MTQRPQVHERTPSGRAEPDIVAPAAFQPLTWQEAARQIRREESVQAGRRTKVQLVLLGSLGLSSWLTGKGLFDKAIEAGTADTGGMVTALMSAGVAGTAVSTASMLLLGTAVEATHAQRIHVLALAGAMLPFILGISTYNAVLGNAGPPSLVYDMRDRAQAYVEYYHATETDSGRALSAVATLEPLRDSTCYLAEQERQSGILTGSSGRGATSAAYMSACRNIGAIIATLNETVARTAGRGAEAGRLLADLQAIPADTTISVFERQARFRSAAREIAALVASAGTERVSARLGPQLEILEASIAGPGTAGGPLGQRQAAANSSLHDTLGTVRDTVRALVAHGVDTPDGEPAELRDMGAAVLAYGHRNIPQILIAVLTDIMPGWFLALLNVSRATFDARRRALLERAAGSAGCGPANRNHRRTAK